MRAVVALTVVFGLLVAGVWSWRVKEQEAAAMVSLDTAVLESEQEDSKATLEGESSTAPTAVPEPARALDDATEVASRPETILEQFRRDAPAAPRKIDHTLGHDELRALAMDLSLSIDERIQAANLLRYGWEGEDPRAGALAAALIDLAAYADGEQRGHIWKALDECEDPQLVEPMLQALLHDPDAGARSEAAESLGTFVGEPRVRTALQQAADTDPDDHVRKEARGSLDG